MLKAWWEKRKRITKEADEILKKVGDELAEAYNREAEEIMSTLSDTVMEEEANL